MGSGRARCYRVQPQSMEAVGTFEVFHASASTSSVLHLELGGQSRPLLLPLQCLRCWSTKMKKTIRLVTGCARRKRRLADRVQARKKPALSRECRRAKRMHRVRNSARQSTSRTNLKGKRAVIVVAAAVRTGGCYLGNHGLAVASYAATNNVVSAGGLAQCGAESGCRCQRHRPANGQGTEVVAGMSRQRTLQCGVVSTAPSCERQLDVGHLQSTEDEERGTTPASADSTKKTAQLDDGQLRTPTRHTKSRQQAQRGSADSAPDLLALAGSSSANHMLPTLVSAPVAKPQFSGQKQKVSSGGHPGSIAAERQAGIPTASSTGARARNRRLECCDWKRWKCRKCESS